MSTLLKETTEISYPNDVVWACAAAADRINGGYRKDQGLGSEVTANKTMVYRYLDLYKHNQLSKSQVTAEDYEKGKFAREFWQNQTLLLLNDNANGYVKSCVTTAHQDTVELLQDIALISSAITAATRELRKQELLELKNSLNSQCVCDVGSTVIFDTAITVINSKYIDKIGASAVECTVQGNLYMWWSKTHIEPGEYSYLKGRVKQHTRDYDTKQPMTQLNYVGIKQ